MNAMQEQIDKQVKGDDIVLFMKGDKSSPRCGFSAQVVHILDCLGLEFQAYDVLLDNELREGIKKYSDWPTLPQLYVRGEFVGGCDIVREMFQSGELLSFFREKGIPMKKAEDI